MLANWRIYIIGILMTISIIDLSLTFYYVNKYRQWQPSKPFKLIENNPLLVFLWNHLGLIIGMIVGSVIILTLIFLVAKSGHWIIVLILFLVLCWTLYNHFHNINLLNKLIEMYPSGHLSEKIFGIVEGNN